MWWKIALHPGRPYHTAESNCCTALCGWPPVSPRIRRQPASINSSQAGNAFLLVLGAFTSCRVQGGEQPHWGTDLAAASAHGLCPQDTTHLHLALHGARRCQPRSW